jgi:hypothetical protein
MTGRRRAPTMRDMTVHDVAGARELDSRDGAGFAATLLWHPVDDALWVTVHDHATGDGFSVDVRAGDRALDVLEHPYAYAVARRTPRAGVRV